MLAELWNLAVLEGSVEYGFSGPSILLEANI
jgi:hypothetical protein